MDGCRFGSQALCPTVVCKRYRDGTLPIYIHLWFRPVTLTLFAYFLAWDPYIFSVFIILFLYFLMLMSVTVGSNQLY